MSTTTTQAIEELKGDVKSILTELRYIKETTNKTDQRLEDYEIRLRNVENKQTSLDTKLTIISILQTSLSVLIGAIASFWGGKQG